MHSRKTVKNVHPKILYPKTSFAINVECRCWKWCYIHALLHYNKLHRRPQEFQPSATRKKWKPTNWKTNRDPHYQTGSRSLRSRPKNIGSHKLESVHVKTASCKFIHVCIYINIGTILTTLWNDVWKLQNCQRPNVNNFTTPSILSNKKSHSKYTRPNTSTVCTKRLNNQFQSRISW